MGQGDVFIVTKAFEMTDIVKEYNDGINAIQHGARAHGYRKGIEAVNLAQVFAGFGINFGPDNKTNNGI